MDTKFWGSSAWKFLHTIVAIYPHTSSPTLSDKLMMRDFMQIVCDILPCKYCRASFTKYSQSLDITSYLESRELLMQWLYKMHNKVNKKLRMIDLQLKKAELERKLSVQSMKENGSSGEKTDLGTGSIMNRDELIKMILSNNDANNPDKNDK